MKLLQICCIALAMAPISAMAESTKDPVYGERIRLNQAKMDQYALENGKAAPAIFHYRYGEKPDVSKVISVTRADLNCAVAPARMTYEDSKGELHTMEYRVMGNLCASGS